MVRTIACVLLALSTTAAAAADLPPNTKLGALFAKPYAPPPAPVVVYDTDYPPFGFAPQIDIQPIVLGYYGNPNSYYYRSYYGFGDTALWDAYQRLPYACWFYRYC